MIDVILDSVHIKKLPQTVNVCVRSPRTENLCRLISLILLIKTIYKTLGAPSSSYALRLALVLLQDAFIQK